MVTIHADEQIQYLLFFSIYFLFYFIRFFSLYDLDCYDLITILVLDY